MDGPHAYQLATLGVAAVAAAFDWRTGRIPNWLTVGALVAALPLHAWMTVAVPNHGPLEGVKWAVLGGLVCAAPLVIGWRLGWIAGGDVKLVAAMGALGGLSLGLEAVFLALLCALSFIVVRLAWTGKFFQSITNTVQEIMGRTVYRSSLPLKPVPPLEAVRFGPFALTGAALSIILHGGFA